MFIFFSIYPETTFLYKIIQMFFLKAVTDIKLASSDSNPTSYSAFSVFLPDTLLLESKFNWLRVTLKFKEESFFLFKSPSRFKTFHNAMGCRKFLFGFTSISVTGSIPKCSGFFEADITSLFVRQMIRHSYINWYLSAKNGVCSRNKNT